MNEEKVTFNEVDVVDNDTSYGETEVSVVDENDTKFGKAEAAVAALAVTGLATVGYGIYKGVGWVVDKVKGLKSDDEDEEEKPKKKSKKTKKAKVNDEIEEVEEESEEE